MCLLYSVLHGAVNGNCHLNSISKQDLPLLPPGTPFKRVAGRRSMASQSIAVAVVTAMTAVGMLLQLLAIRNEGNPPLSILYLSVKRHTWDLGRSESQMVAIFGNISIILYFLFDLNCTSHL